MLEEKIRQLYLTISETVKELSSLRKNQNKYDTSEFFDHSYNGKLQEKTFDELSKMIQNSLEVEMSPSLKEALINAKHKIEEEESLKKERIEIFEKTSSDISYSIDILREELVSLLQKNENHKKSITSYQIDLEGSLEKELVAYFEKYNVIYKIEKTVYQHVFIVDSDDLDNSVLKNENYKEFFVELLEQKLKYRYDKKFEAYKNLFDSKYVIEKRFF